ncbi:MAG: dTMP kinase [Xanthobacteraceae bacterium]|nr:dTMP kinase [Xanthobacteraceae bacterium]
MRGRFITLEGGEGAGKSTQAALLAERLADLGIAAVKTREPGGSPGAEIVRDIVLSGLAKPFGPQAETLLFAAARRDHLESLIKPALAAGKWVICDRFIDSTRVYQGILGKAGSPLVRALERITVGDAMPDLTIILDLPAEVGLARARARRAGGAPDRFEGEDLGFHQRLNAAFREIAAEEPGRCVVIEADRPAEAVAADIRAKVEERFGLTHAGELA